ncbi:MAG: flagellar basal body P-ring formation protein FlgA [Anaerohalosphaera sp.]|nr:flagellar basal body P-ring formation protein FlgA [Anaerohalosphaera sp.]
MTRNRTKIYIVMIVLISVSATSLNGGQADKSKVQIHLPREITVEKNNITLGDVSIMIGDEKLSSKAKKISLGRITTGVKNLVIDRKTILGRLACSDVDISRINLTGAKKIVVSQSSVVLEDDRIVEAAREFLKNNLPAENVCYFKAVYSGNDIQVDEEVSKLTFKCSTVAGTSRNYAKVKVQVFDGEKCVCDREVNFRLKFKVKKMTAKENIERGQVLTADKYTVKEEISDYPAVYQWSEPLGLVARRKLVKGMVIRPEMLQAEKSSVVVKRNGNLTVRVEKYGFVLSVLAKALEDGTEGDLIRVRNVDSNRIITVKINPDGTASPII